MPTDPTPHAVLAQIADPTCVHCGKPIRLLEGYMGDDGPRPGIWIHKGGYGPGCPTTTTAAPAADPLCAQPDTCAIHKVNLTGVSCPYCEADEELDQHMAPDPTCANADCGDVEEVRAVLRDALVYLMQFGMSPDHLFQKAAREIMSTGKPLSAQPAETPYPADLQHWYRDKNGRVFWSNCVLSGVEPVAAPDTTAPAPRYNVYHALGFVKMIDAEHGLWVKYTDHSDALRAVRAEYDAHRALEARNKVLEDTLRPLLEAHCCDTGEVDYRPEWLDENTTVCDVCRPARAALAAPSGVTKETV